MKILSLGTATPPYAITLDDRHEVAEKFVAGDEKDRWFTPYIFEKSTVEKRYSVFLNSAEGSLLERQNFFTAVAELEDQTGPSTETRMKAYQQHATDLAIQSCQKAFANAGIDPKQVTHLVTASCTGFSAPGVDIDLICKLPLRPTTSRTHLGFMGCHAGMNAMRVANAYAAADPNACVLVCSTELCTLHFQSVAENDQKVANALFADGSGAAIFVGDNFVSEKSTNWSLKASGSCILPDTLPEMGWHISDHGFVMTLSERIPALILEHVRPWLESWLDQQGMKLSDIASWAIHPGGPQILHSAMRALQLKKDQLSCSYDVLKNYGNMSSATIFFVLQETMKKDAKLPCVAMGFGPGLTIEVALFV